ncbi:MAG: peptidylprolyl isomerase [Bacteroidota bacterium]|nr:peptidylprolyl isomerase [Bacteroidota bacterium]
MKKWLTVIAAVVTVRYAAVSQTALDRIVAVVDKEIITQSDLDYAVLSVATQNKLDPKSPDLRSQVLDELIDEKLVLAQAELDSVTVTDDEVTDQLDRQIKLLSQQYGSEQKLEEVYKMPVSKMKREFREEIRKRLLIQKIRQQRQANINISRLDVEQFYEANKDSLPIIPKEYELSHIYMQPKPDTAVVQRVYSEALAIIDSIKAGGDFADFARRYSADPGSAAQGGDLGWWRRGSFVPEFEAAAFALKDSEISEPVRTKFGYHIIQLLERRGESVHTRHILLKIEQSNADDDSTIAELKRLRNRALAGENFGVLARKYSEDQDTKDIGGDLGKVPVDQIDPSFLEVLKPLTAGDISEPAKVPVGNSYGYHIVWVRSITPEHKMNLDEDYRRLQQLTLQFKANEDYEKWLKGLRKTIYWQKKI